MSQAINTVFAAQTADFGLYDIVLVQFPDGTTAEFQLTGDSTIITQRQWTWVQGRAWNSPKGGGAPINRDGSLQKNPNTSGKGAGAASTSGFGSSGGKYNFDVVGTGDCQFQTTITVNGASTSYIYVSPC